MAVLRALLARTATVVCIFATVMACQEEDPWICLHMIMMLFVFATLRPLLNHKRGILIFLFYILFAINFIQLQNKASDKEFVHFVKENALPHFQFRHTLSSVVIEISNVVLFFYNLLKILGTRSKVLLLWLVYLCSHAALILLILDWLYVTIYRNICQHVLSQVYSTFDETKIRDKSYPRSYFSDKYLNASTFESPGVKRMFYAQNPELDHCQLRHIINMKKVKSGNGVRLPYTYSKSTRYVGEDVEFTCIFTITAQGEHEEISWTLDDRKIRNKTRISYHTTYEQVYSDENFISGISKLRVQMLRYSDFGVYKCVLDSILEYEFYVERSKLTLVAYVLDELPQNVEMVYKSVGDLVDIGDLFLYHTFADFQEVFFEYTVNDENIDQVCSGFNDQFCSFGARLFQGFGHFRTNLFPVFELKKYFRSEIIKTASTSYCVCGRAFGVHKVTFVRKLKLKSGKTLMIDATNPIVLVVLPQANISLFRMFDDSHLFTEVTDLISTGANISVIQRTINGLINLIDANEQKILYLANLIQSIITSILLVIVVTFLYFISKLYCNIFIIRPALIYIHNLPLTERI